MSAPTRHRYPTALFGALNMGAWPLSNTKPVASGSEIADHGYTIGTPMTEKDDDKPVISLVEKREAQGRDFAQERADMIKDLLEFGLSMERATAIAENVLLCDWLFLQATIILGRWDLEENTEAVIKLVEMMHRGRADG
jgi:hypothetical protein